MALVKGSMDSYENWKCLLKNKVTRIDITKLVRKHDDKSTFKSDYLQ
jgi:hypothetical protein